MRKMDSKIFAILFFFATIIFLDGYIFLQIGMSVSCENGGGKLVGDACYNVREVEHDEACGMYRTPKELNLWAFRNITNK